jgi:hypothetical protein
MARGKVGAVRLVANWALIEPTDDAWRFGALDNYVGDLAVVLECTGSRSPSEPTNGLVLKSWKAVVAQRYGPGGAHWTTRYPIDHPGEQPSPVKGRHQAQSGLEAVRPLYRRVVSFTGGS